MKKNCLIVLVVLVVCTTAFSCKSHKTCAAYTKANNLKSDKSFVDKTEKNS